MIRRGDDESLIRVLLSQAMAWIMRLLHDKKVVMMSLLIRVERRVA